MMLEQRILQLTEELVAAYSPTNTAQEQKAEQYILQFLQEQEYFQSHCEQCGLYAVADDIHKRSTVYGLVMGKSRKTVIFMGHHDVVNTEVYGNIADCATNHERLVEALKTVPLAQEALDDLKSGEWLFGRGSCDMKGGTALQMALLEEYAKSCDAGSLLFISVPDEEAFSAGMRSCLPLLQELRDKYNLEYVLAINCEPNSMENGVQTAYAGSVGKILPVVVVQGKSVQIGSYSQGVNPVAVLAEIISCSEADYSFCDSAGEERTIPPVWSFMRDLKREYDFSLPLRCAGYCNILNFSKTPEEVLAWLQEKCKAGAEAAMKKQNCGHSVRVLTYAELLTEAERLNGFAQFYEKLQEQVQMDLQKNLSYPELTISTIEQILEFVQFNEAAAVIAFAPPYYPAVNSNRLCADFSETEKYLQQLLPVKIKQYFMGISDCSYLGVDKKYDYKTFTKNTPLWSKVYSFDTEILEKLQIPFLLLGPWGKDLHQKTERVNIYSLCKKMPDVIRRLCYFQWENKFSEK